MATTKPTIAVNFGVDEPPQMLSIDEFAKLIKAKDSSCEASSSTEDFGKVDKPKKRKSTDGRDSCDSEEKEEEDDDDEKSNLPVGSVSEVKNVFKSAEDANGVFTWVRKYPEDVDEPAENAVTDTYAVLVRNIKSPDGRKKLEAHSVVIQSPWLKKALRDHVLNDYPGVACELERLTFEAPFEPFVHRWTNLKECMQRKDLDDKTLEHLTVLRDILQYEIGDSIKAYEDYLQNGVVTFKHLWMIFQPGSVILAVHGGALSAFELDETEYDERQGEKFLNLEADCVDFSDNVFGRYTEQIEIAEFVGTRKIAGLNAYPLAFHENQDAVVAQLTKRGQVFEELAGYHYKAYDGTAISWDFQGDEIPIQISGRIIVDIQSFNNSNLRRKHRLGDWNATDIDRLREYRKTHGLAENGHLRLPPYYQMLARSRTRGYSLKRKEWLEFFVEHIGEIEWNDSAFNKLVLPDDQKELILAFSESQLEGGACFDDVISGKGKGIICLLSGPPGVGKTLTAEAVAENLRVPLHTLSSGDLGSDPIDLEIELTKILNRVARWHAILLIDECDVFLEARSTQDLERNKVVSIFLRTLEYYEGIMFMTTNRVGNMDPAFDSRIHVSLEYPDLSIESRAQIWKSFLATFQQKPEISEEDINDFARMKLNGRQIKNILKTSHLLAARRKSVLRRSFVDTVLAIQRGRPAVAE